MVSREKHVDRVNDDFTELSILLKTRSGLNLEDERLETSLLEILKAETNLDDLVKKMEKLDVWTITSSSESLYDNQ